MEINLLDTLWVLIAAILVFLMQAGFKVLESGLVRPSHKDSVSIKNLLDFMIGGLGFYVVGFGFMFGKSDLSFLGNDYFCLQNFLPSPDLKIDHRAFFIFQLCFVGTSLTIVSGAMSERINVMSYLIISCVIAAIIYPTFGYWAWGNLFHASNEPWLAKMGFIDFAGSTVVHSIGAWVALVGVFMIGPRIGRFSSKGKPLDMEVNSHSYSMLGVILLWFGWWGFNGGSTLAFNLDVGKILMNTNLAAITGGLVAFGQSYFFSKNNHIIEKTIGGVLTALVAVTACCHLVSAPSALLLGACAGIIHNLSYDLLIRMKLDDAVGAIPVHGVGGAFGTIFGVALFSESGTLENGRLEQLGIQTVGVLAAFLLSTTIAFIVFYILKKTMGIRISPEQEIEGNIWGITSYNRLKSREKEQKDRANKTEISYVSINVNNAGFNVIPVSDFLKLPLNERNDLFNSNQVKFWDESGNIIQQLEASTLLAKFLESEKVELELLHEEEYKKNKNTSDSIRYARQIQNAVSPSREKIQKLVGDHLLINKPKDIVGGDFCWVTEKNEYVLLALGDCTGHGVPGGFLTMMGVSFLNEVLKEFTEWQEPSLILNELRTKFKKAMNDEDNDHSLIKDGMNISLIVWDKKTNKAYYSGAYHPLWHVKKQTEQAELIEYKGDRMPIGIHEKETPFTSHTIELEKGDFIYLFSDGFVDQFGGENNTKITPKRLKDKILHMNIENSTITEQKELLVDFYDTWKGSNDQIDDVMLIGVKVS